ncbi:AsmA family protein [Salinisphaera sp. T31B1]|uniref:AsmA family protein n=1 Tax=Salinisphaera sp. T31B1 TaxID=727963 RepID=UPI003341E724
MKRFVKILIGVVIALLVVAVLGLGALALWFDPNDYKSEIHAAIERQIGRSVDIQGDIELSVFPWLGVELGRVTVANAPGFGEQPMAEMAGAAISVKLLPLITRQIEVGTVSLDGLRLRLARNAAGRDNWTDITEHLSADQNSDPSDPEPPNSSEDETAEPAPAGGEQGFRLSSLQIGAIEVHDAAVSWRDEQADSDYRIDGFNLETGRLSDGQPVRLEFSGDIKAPAHKVDAAFNLVTRIEPDVAEQFYRFSGLSLNLLATGEGVPAGRQQATLSGSGELDLADGRLKLAGVSLQGAGLNITGNLDSVGLNADPSYSGRVTVKTFDPRAVMRELDIAAPATQKASALSSAGFDAQFNGTPSKIEFKQILATLDGSSLKGSAGIADFAQPSIGFDLGLDQLNVDDYLPPGSAEQARTDTPPETGGGDQQKDAEIDLSALDDLRLDGKLAVAALTAANIRVTDAKLTVKARDGVLTIDPLTADLYQGNLRMAATVDASGDTPGYTLAGNLNGLQFQPLLEDMADTDKISALASMNVDVRTAGRQVAAMKRGLSGDFGFDLRDGSFNGFDLRQMLAGARARFSGSQAAESGSGIGSEQKTPFGRMNGSFDIDRGVVSGDDLTLVTPFARASGAGQYDLASNALDYTVKTTVADEASGKLADLAGVSVPIHLTGNLLAPSYSLDIGSALKGLADQRLADEKAKLADKVRQKIDARADKVEPEVADKIKQGIRGLFGNGDKADDDAQQPAR